MSRLDYFVGVSGATPEIADRVLAEVTKIVQRYAGRVSTESDMVTAIRPWDTVGEHFKRGNVDVFLHVVGPDEAATRRFLDYVKRETGPGRLTDPFFAARRAAIVVGTMSDEFRRSIEEQDRLRRMS